ncbi:MAG TPA: hypothetical protein VND91_12115 [Candidatus Saccharimonadia bacterium]|nr:hypothetical protein [Candidatus Saccharimonadia bacterium]
MVMLRTLASACLLCCALPAVAEDPIAKGGFSVRLQGRAFFTAPLANASLSVSGAPIVSGSPTTDAAGNYDITISSVTATQVVTLTARGVGGDAAIVYRTTPGTLQSLITAAAGDGIVTSAEEPYIDLTPFTTGVHLALTAAVAPTPLAGQPEFDRAKLAFSPSDAFRRTFIIAALSSGAVTRPIGYTSTLDTASTISAAGDTFDRMFGPTDCLPAACAARDAVFAPPVVPVAPLIENVEYRTYIPFAPESLGSLYEGLRFDTGSTGQVRGLKAPQAFTWSATSGSTFRLVPNSGSFGTFINFPFLNCGAGLAQVQSQVTTNALNVRILRGPGGTTLLQLGDESTTTFPFNPECAAQGGTKINAPRSFVNVVPGTTPLQFDDPAGTTMALPSCSTRCAGSPVIEFSSDNFVNEFHTFVGGGTGTTQRLGLTFTWVRNPDGTLQLAYSNGASAKFTRLADESPAYGSVMLEFNDTDGTAHVAHGTYMLRDPVGDFGTATGDFYSKNNKGSPFATVDTSLRLPFGFRFQPDGTGSRLDGLSRVVRWSLSPDRRRLTFDQFADATSTANLARRIWDFVRIDGDDVYVLENSFGMTNAATGSATPTDRLFAYTRSPIPTPGNVPNPNGAIQGAASDAGDGAGEAVAAAADVLIVGAPNGNASGANAGEVYVFSRPAAIPASVLAKGGVAGWAMKELTLLATLTPPAGAIGDKFGAALAVSPDGSRIVIGSPGASTGAGGVSMFTKPISGWTNDSSPDASLSPPSGAGGFGATLALGAGGTLAVGAPRTDDGVVEDSGMAAVYQPSGGAYPATPSVTMMNPAPQAGANFGAAVAASDTRIAVGAPNQDTAGGDDVGAVHTWQASSPGAAFAAGPSLPAPDGVSGNKFGSAVGVAGKAVVAAAPGADTPRGLDAGAAYVFEDPGAGLPTTPSAQLTPQGNEGDGAGATLAIVGGTIVLGAPLAVRGGKPASGAAFVFRRPDESWVSAEPLPSQQELVPLTTEANQRYGASLALGGLELIVGVPARDGSAATVDRGEAETYSLERIFGTGFE